MSEDIYEYVKKEYGKLTEPQLAVLDWEPGDFYFRLSGYRASELVQSRMRTVFKKRILPTARLDYWWWEGEDNGFFLVFFPPAEYVEGKEQSFPSLLIDALKDSERELEMLLIFDKLKVECLVCKL